MARAVEEGILGEGLMRALFDDHGFDSCIKVTIHDVIQQHRFSLNGTWRCYRAACLHM